MSTSKHSTLTQQSLVKFIEDVELEFTAAYDTAPPLPRPVPKGYKLIRLLCIIENAREAAPMKPLEELKTITERRVQRLATYYVRASELSHCHAQLAAKKTLTNKSLQLACLGATTAVSIILKSGAGLDPDLLLVLSGIVVTVVGAITSWTKYADYEDKAQRHTLASDAFAQLAAAIAAALTLASDEAEAALKEKVAHLDRLTTLAQRVLKVGAARSRGGGHVEPAKPPPPSPPTSPPAPGDIEAVMPTPSMVTALSSSDDEDEGTDETTPQTGEEANLALQACSACLPSDPRSQRSAPPPPPHLCTALFAHSSAAPVHLLLPCPAAAAAHGA